MLGLFSQQAFGDSITYNSSVTANSGEIGVFALPYSAASGTAVTGTWFGLGTFQTNSANPSVVSDDFQLTVTPTVSGTSFTPVVFYAAITNPATNIYCIDLSTTNSGFNSSMNCQSANPNTVVSETFDNGLYSVYAYTFTQINSPGKTTNLFAEFVTDASTVPEPASVAGFGIGLVVLAVWLRRKAFVRQIA